MKDALMQGMLNLRVCQGTVPPEPTVHVVDV
jgi:hypothetical protein